MELEIKIKINIEREREREKEPGNIGTWERRNPAGNVVLALYQHVFRTAYLNVCLDHMTGETKRCLYTVFVITRNCG